MTDPAPTSGAAVWRLGRVSGVVGLAAIVQIFVAVVGAREEPSFTATATEFVVYYRSPDTVATPFRSFLFTLGLVGLRLVSATRFGTVPDDPTGEMPDEGACCGRNCL
jgi:hypothetical protein